MEIKDILRQDDGNTLYLYHVQAENVINVNEALDDHDSK